ncbi:putative alpha/beta hydrolase-3 [Helianthus debilis subsp. tardiflorus]
MLHEASHMCAIISLNTVVIQTGTFIICIFLGFKMRVAIRCVWIRNQGIFTFLTWIYLMGQSAGAHIAACALVEQAIKESDAKQTTTWSVSQIKAYFGLSGGYNMFNLADHLNTRGPYKSLFMRIMGGEESLRKYSPEIVIQDPNNNSAVSLLPPVILFHGTADYSIPADCSKTFAESLQRVGAKAELKLYEGKTHTDVFVQDPMRGDDKLFDDLVAIIHGGDEEAPATQARASRRRRLVPEFMLKLAGKISPF